jgi:WD40 repeat protein
VTADNRILISGSYDHQLLVWCIEKGAVLGSLQGHENAVTCVKMTGDSATAISGIPQFCYNSLSAIKIL